MKIKRMLIFIFIFIIIISTYFGIVLNINNFTKSYNGKQERYANPYYKYKDMEKAIYKIQTLAQIDSEEISDECVDLIRGNKIISNIINTQKMENYTIEKYIKNLMKYDRIKLINYYNMIYISGEGYFLGFSLDMNNIAFEIETIHMGTSRSAAGKQEVDMYQQKDNDDKELSSSKELLTQKKEEIFKITKEKLNQLGITEKFNFEPQSIYIKYYNDEKIEDSTQVIYAIEDATNNIKIEIESSKYEIVSLEIGFEYFITRA